MRAWCWRQELNPQPLAYEALALPLCYASNPRSASPETSARVGSTGRGSALCTGALSLKTLSFTQVISRAHPFGRERFARTRTPSGTSVRRELVPSSSSTSLSIAEVSKYELTGRHVRAPEAKELALEAVEAGLRKMALDEAHIIPRATGTIPGMIALIENYQEADGSVVLPDVLVPYMGGMKKIERA